MSGGRAYDSPGLLITTTVGYGTPLAQRTVYEYDALGRSLSPVLLAFVTVFQALEHVFDRAVVNRDEV